MTVYPYDVQCNIYHTQWCTPRKEQEYTVENPLLMDTLYKGHNRKTSISQRTSAMISNVFTIHFESLGFSLQMARCLVPRHP